MSRLPRIQITLFVMFVLLLVIAVNIFFSYRSINALQIIELEKLIEINPSSGLVDHYLSEIQTIEQPLKLYRTFWLIGASVVLIIGSYLIYIFNKSKFVTSSKIN